MKNPYYNPSKRHHRPDGFQNNYISFSSKRWHEILRWRWQAWRAGHPRPITEPIAVVPPELAFIRANAQAGLKMQPAVTWIGHITVLALTHSRLIVAHVVVLGALPSCAMGRTEAPDTTRADARSTAAHRRGAAVAQPL